MSLKILLIEDEIKIAEFVIPDLIQCEYTVNHIMDGAEGLAAILEGDYDLVLLDVMLPNIDGFTILEKVRQSGNNIPIIFLTAKADLPDRLQGFERGADDYLAKPFFVEELIARIKAIASRKNNVVTDEVTIGGLTINKISHRAEWVGTSAILSQREFSLIEYLMRSPNYIFSRKQILKHVWGISFNPETNVVDVYIQRIRKKLNRKNTNNLPFPIETVRGVGYTFRLEHE
jgi:DNA-binding response OmpR family regulator